MGKNKTKKKVVASNQVRDEKLLAMIVAGEQLGVELMELLSQHGCSPQALLVETYAVAMLWASLKAVAYSEGYEPEELFEFLVPTFKEEMEEYVRTADDILN